jgi:hypothetical protein
MKTLKPSGSKGFMTSVTKKDAAIAPKSQTEAQRKQVRFGKEEQQRKRTLTFEKKSEQAIQSLLRLGAAIQIRTGDLILTKDALYRLSYSSKWRRGRDLNPRPPA